MRFRVALTLVALIGTFGCRKTPEVLTAKERESIRASLAFVSERSGGPQTYMILATGQGERRLMDGAAFPSVAAPDGSALLVLEVTEQGEEHQEQLSLLPLPAGERLKLGPPAQRVRSPSWSPDGRTILFTSSAEGFSDVRTISRDGTGLVRLTSDPQGAFEPSFSPDGKSLVYVTTRDGDPELYRMSVSGTEDQRLTKAAREDTAPAWSPSGKWIGFISNRDGSDQVFLMAPDGTGQRAVGGGPPGANDRELAWSPDGAHLAFVRRAQGGVSRICVVEVATGNVRVLTDGKFEESMPAWSPDGKYLAFTSDRTGDTELFLMRADGTAQTQLTKSPGPDWRAVWIPQRASAQ